MGRMTETLNTLVEKWRTRRSAADAAVIEGLRTLRRTRVNRRLKALKGHTLQPVTEPTRRWARIDQWCERDRPFWKPRQCWWYVPPGQSSIHGFAWTRWAARARLAHLVRVRRAA